VVIGSAYNGQGQPEAPGNAVAHGTAQATGNAPAWFPGSQRQGRHKGHAHTASLSGFKSQSLDASRAQRPWWTSKNTCPSTAWSR